MAHSSGTEATGEVFLKFEADIEDEPISLGGNCVYGANPDQVW